MALPSARSPRRWGWGLGASVLAHLLLVAAFLASPALPDLNPPDEETVSVEMVPPPPEPEKAEPEKPEPEKKEPEKKEPEKAEEKKPEPPQPPSTSARHVAIRPTLSEAPEREDQVGQTEDRGAPVETRPDAPPEPEPPQAPQKADQPGAPDRPPGAGGDTQGATTPEAPAEPQASPPAISKPAAEEKPSTPPPAGTPTPATEPTQQAALPQMPSSETGEAMAALPPAEDGFAPALPREDAPMPSPRPASGQAARPSTGAAGGGALKVAKPLNAAPIFRDPLARFALGQMPRKQQVQNLCVYEATDQIRRSRPGSEPEGVFINGNVTGTTVNAANSFYRSQGKWYRIDLACTADLKHLKIEDFRFQLGGEVTGALAEQLDRRAR
ncbi:hypothetical protein BJF93_20670 [Xaviernesmea oryzae]|uniref:Uncharacterized protein n=2 Tax=Xaviernesmea oryzae TaxID=464029 RepID=A0A1Q9AZP5_9HYPH|nr:hypothetical protein BJF93_20670 [Xaviernesmea oryzae]